MPQATVSLLWAGSRTDPAFGHLWRLRFKHCFPLNCESDRKDALQDEKGDNEMDLTL